MAGTGRISRISASKYVAPKTGRIARISATSNHVTTPKTGRISAIVATATGATPGPRVGRISSISAYTAAAGAPRGRISRISASTASSNVVMPAARTVNSNSTVTLTATAAGSGIWEWQQTAGTTVSFTATAGTIQFISPMLKNGDVIAFQARAQINGTWTPWAAINVTVRKHRYWTKRSGTLTPLLSKPRTTTPPSSETVGVTSNIPCYGDSMVAGFGIGVPASWPTKLQEILPGGRTTQNLGVSSQTAQEIAMRQGGMPINLVFPSNTIPASGAVTVTTPDTIIWGAVAWTVTGTVGGVTGVLSHPSGTAGTNTATLTWTRTGSGSTVALGGATAFRSSAGDRDKVQIFLAGRNDYGIGGVDSTIRNRVINANKAMVDWLTSPYFIVLSNITLTSETSGTRGYNNVVAVNSALQSLYGERFLDIRRWLIDNGMAALSITPTSADLAAVAADTMPPSLMYDSIHWNAATADLVADKIFERLIQLHYLPSTTGTTEQPTAGLFFKLPDMRSSPRKVLAHYFGPYPRSINNSATLASDSYTTTFNNPRSTATFGSESAANFGGAFRDRPIWRTQITGDYKYADARWDIEQAQAAGIDGFFCDLLGLSGSNYDNYETLKRAAHDMNTGFVVVPMLDVNGATAAASITSAAAYIASFAGKNCSWYLPDGRFVVSCFKAEGKTVQYWTDLFAAIQANHGLTVAFIGVFTNTNQIPNYTSVDYGSSAWGYGADPAVVNAAANQAPAARARGEKWMAPVVPQDQRPQNSLYDEALNTGTLRATWEKAIAQEADYVQMVTWSDYSETAMAPSVANGWVNLDISSWYITRWKTGSYPTILKDALYLSHRGQTLDSVITGPQSKFMAHWPRGNMSAVRNNVEVLSFLTAPANITVTVGTATYTYTAPAGQYSTSFPAVAASAGTVKATAVRSSTTVSSVTSPVAIRTTSLADDKQYFRFSSIRGTTGQYDVLTQYT